MRKTILAALLASLTLSILGCGETAAPPPTQEQRAQLPGAPSEGPEVLKTKKKG
ncbi:hypothetical protein [Paludisphaera rhizosphaerae]|uniref:hypothetical protein n=1 Tax=Paludisphaera rhizosphaerae TaxID=2711216 RepID=UPI0013EBC6FC|nr:hypothetical protein [Paludisphaera rhizosphaerae]